MIELRKNKAVKLSIIALLALTMIPIATHPTHAVATAASGFKVTDFATGFANNGVCALSCIGPIGLTFDASGNLYVGDPVNGYVYKFGPTGGIASATTQLATPSSLGGSPVGMAFGKDGNLYLNILSLAKIVQLDPVTGSIIRTVASSVTGACDLATDPLSGDLFVSQACNYNGVAVFRVSNFTSGPGTVTVYSSGFCADGLAFGADGTLYAAQCGAGVRKIAGTNSTSPGSSSFIASVTYIDGMAVSSNPSTKFLFGNRNDGIITKVDLTSGTPIYTDVVTGGTRGDFATVGPDGCLYATQSDRILKVTNADGSCIPPPLGPLTLPPNVSRLTVTKFFTDSSLNPLLLDKNGNPSVNVVIASGEVQRTNPGQVLAWVSINNTGATPIQSLKLNDTLPVDWAVDPAWNPGKGGIHVYYANTTSLSTNPDITQPSTLTASSGNPQTVHLAIPNLNATIIGHPLMHGQSLLLSVKLSYALKGTSQAFRSYPRNYTDTASAVAWAQPSFTGSEATGTGSAFFVAYARVLGDVNGDGNVDMVDITMIKAAYGTHPGDAGWLPSGDFDNDGFIGITDISIAFYYYGTSS